MPSFGQFGGPVFAATAHLALARDLLAEGAQGGRDLLQPALDEGQPPIVMIELAELLAVLHGLSRVGVGGPSRSRTCDQTIMSRLL